MLQLRKIAVTGAPGSGKSTVCELFAEFGAYVIDADCIAHELIKGPCRQAILDLFGHEIEKNGQIDRHEIAKIVFKNPGQLKALEKILHPEILKHIQQDYQRIASLQIQKLFVAEIPLLFELGWEKWFDISISVSAQPTTCKSRVSYDWDARMQHQLSIDEKNKRADFIIQNDGNKDQLKQQIQEIIS